MSSTSPALLRLPITAKGLDGRADPAALTSLCVDALYAWWSRQGRSRRVWSALSDVPRFGPIAYEPLGEAPQVGAMIEVNPLRTSASGVEFELRQVGSPNPFAAARLGWMAATGQALPPVSMVALPQQLPPPQIVRLMGSADCDQAGHVNVQVFADLADAALIAVSIHAACAPGGPRLRADRMRISFRSELFAGDLVRVCTAVAAIEAGHIDTVHAIVNESTGEIACVVEATTALTDSADRDGLPGPEDLRTRLEPLMGPWEGMPSIKPPQGLRANDRPSSRAIDTCRETIDSWDADASSAIHPRTLVRWCSTGARQFLAQIGLDGARFAREQITVAAVDYLIQWYAPARVGMNVLMRSALLDASAKSLRFCHHLLDADRDEVLATIEIVGVMFDLRARKSMEIPGDVRDRLDQVKR